MAIALVSESTTGGGGNGDSLTVNTGGRAISADGRYLVYYGDASDLVTDDTNGARDIFLYDAISQTTTLISRNALGDSANGASEAPSISADGRYVVYYSLASDLVAGDTNGFRDIFLYDTVSQTTVLISNDASGGPSDDGSFFPSISADGRYVVYHSFATDLVAGDSNGARDIFLYDTVSQTTELISKDASGTPSDGDSYTPSISADGRYVVYSSNATDLVAGDTNNRRDIFLYDTVSQTTTLISSDASVGPSDFDSYEPTISRDGRYVVYSSNATNLVAGDTNNRRDIFLYDTVSQTTALISIDASAGPSNGHSYTPSISADGRYVVYYSLASDLVADDLNGYPDIFVYDTQTGTTALVSVDSGGGGTDNSSYSPSISDDGSTIVFDSYASVFVANDTNFLRDVYIADNPLFAPVGPTTNTDTLAGDGNDNSVDFDSTTLNNGDSYDGQGGNDRVNLNGGGTFDFAGTTFTSVEDIQTDGTNSILDFSGFGSTEADREGIAGLISSAGGANDVVKMGEWHQDLAILASMFGAGIETVEWTRSGGFDYSAVRNGSGQTVVTSTDTGNSRTYDTIDQTFDTNGILRESVTTYDDGRVATTNYNAGGGMTGIVITDPLNAVNYQTLENVYSGGLLQSSSLTFDNGNTSVKSYTSGVLTQTVESDVADDFTWDVKTTTYNTSGVKTGYVVDYDAGEARSQMSFAYTGGILTNRTITNSDGSASEASYNTSGEMQHVRNTASDGTQFILGGTGDNTLTGGSNDDLFKGGTGTDIFEFSGTVGNDTILDFTDGQDRLDLSAYGYTSLADLQNASAISEVNGNTVIDLGADGSVTLNGLALSDFGGADLVGFVND
ncbi:MAG: PD40 domain-containing protein [Nitratireductor sp.]|nr:PD40 domain-containing protein [Nitratireductor sp.]